MATIEGIKSETETIERLVETLRELPDVDAQDPILQTMRQGDRQIDAEIEFNTGGKSYVLLVEVKKSVYPRDAQQILWQLDRYVASIDASDRRKHVMPLLAAESISPGAKDILKAEKCGYFDSGGSLFIPARGAYVYIEKPPPKTLQKSIRSLFTGKRSQVAHALLNRRDEWFGVKELAKLAEVSPATASETLSALERFEWVTARGQGPIKERRVTDPGALLNEWQKQTLAAPRRQANRRFYVPASDPDAIANHLAEICERLGLDYVLTEQYAAQVYAPFLSSVGRVTCRMEPNSQVNEVYAELQARPVNEGANLVVIETRARGEFLFRQRVDPFWLASPVQVYLDLLHSGGRGKEMAEHLRHERIGF